MAKKKKNNAPQMLYLEKLSAQEKRCLQDLKKELGIKTYSGIVRYLIKTYGSMTKEREEYREAMVEYRYQVNELNSKIGRLRDSWNTLVADPQDQKE